MKGTIHLLFCYGLALVFLYPIIAHVLMYQLEYFKDELPYGRYWIYVQIFLSGPLLITIGLMVYFRYGNNIIHKALGALISLIGVWWLFNIIRDIIREAA